MEKKSKNTRVEDAIDSLKVLIKTLSSRIDILENRLERSEAENARLINENIELDTKIDAAESQLKEVESKLKKTNKEKVVLKEEVESLNKKLYRKNSRNSSIPPSKDENRPKKNRSLREQSDKPVGGQKGHKGNSLKMNLNPTDIINHIPELCSNCGQALTGDIELVKRRQVIDIPPVEAHVMEHRSFKRQCGCGECTIGTFPKNVKAPISYGTRIEAFIAYLSTRQYIPVKRIEELLSQVFGISMSAGTICNKLASSSNKLLKYYSWIQDQIKRSRIVGSDETGCRVNGEKGWIWTWQNDLFTYLKYSSTRGEQTIRDTFPKGLPNSIMVHDCLAAQFNIACKGHQICTAHLLRELNFFIDQGDEWSKKFKRELMNALGLLKEIKSNPKKNYRRRINQIYKRVDELLLGKKGRGKLEAYKERMRKRRASLFRYLEDPSIPPDNNGSERAIRNVKVKTKVSGMFKTDLGADQFAIIRSVIDTFLKRRQPLLQSLMKAVS